MNPVEEWIYKYKNYWELSSEVWKYNEIQSALKEWWEILLAIEAKYWKDSALYRQFEKEYRDLYETIKSSFEDDKKFSQEERAKIIFELWDVVLLAQKEWIREKKAWYSRLWDWAKGTNTNEVKQKAEALRDKKVEDFSVDEAISAMNYLSVNYKNYDETSKWEDNVSKAKRWAAQLLWSYSTINELDDRHEVRLFQDKLIQKIFWNEVSFNDKYIVWFNNERWNYLVTIWDFEKQLKWWIKVWDINSRALWNYFLYLKNQNRLETTNLLNIFGPDVLFELAKIWWESNDTDTKYAFNYLKDNWGWEILDIIKLFSSPDVFLKEAYKLKNNPKKAELALELLNKNLNSIKEQFKKDLKEKFKKSNPNMSESEIDKIIEEMFDELMRYKDLNWLLDIYKTFDEYNKKYKLWLDINKEAEELLKQKTLNLKTQILKNSQELEFAKKEWNNNKVQELEKNQKKLELELSDLKLAGKANQKFTNQDISDFVSWKKEISKAIEEFIKNDKEFAKLYDQVDKEKKQYEGKYWEEGKQENKFQEIKVSNKQIDYGDGTVIEYKESWWNYLINTSYNKIKVNHQEFLIISSSKEALKNLVKFRETLDELNLSWLWRYREQIFKWIANKYVINFNLKDNYLWENEMKIFLLAILKSVWIEPKSKTNFTVLKQWIMEKNNSWIFNNQKEINRYFESMLDKEFISRFDSNRNGSFNFQAFSDSLDWLAWIRV